MLHICLRKKNRNKDEKNSMKVLYFLYFLSKGLSFIKIYSQANKLLCIFIFLNKLDIYKFLFIFNTSVKFLLQNCKFQIWENISCFFPTALLMIFD